MTQCILKCYQFQNKYELFKKISENENKKYKSRQIHSFTFLLFQIYFLVPQILDFIRELSSSGDNCTRNSIWATLPPSDLFKDKVGLATFEVEGCVYNLNRKLNFETFIHKCF